MIQTVSRRLAGALFLVALLAGCTPEAGTGVDDGTLVDEGQVAEGGTAPDADAPPAEDLAMPTLANAAPVLGCAAFEEGATSLNIAMADVLVAVDEGCPDVEIQFVDARVAAEYELGHLPGSLNVPYHSPQPYYDTLPKDKWLMTYCACPNAEASQLANMLVKEGGFTKVRYIDEGMAAWTEGGREMVTGKDPG